MSKMVALMGYPLGLPWQVVSRPSQNARQYRLMEPQKAFRKRGRFPTRRISAIRLLRLLQVDAIDDRCIIFARDYHPFNCAILSRMPMPPAGAADAPPCSKYLLIIGSAGSPIQSSTL